MSIKGFGQYLIEIESPKIGLEICLDGYDGFDDQTLWNFKKNDKISFVINPSNSKDLLNHNLLVTEVLEDTNNNDWANVIITDIITLDNLFRNNTIEYINDFHELLNYYENLWNQTLVRKEKIKNYKYCTFHNHFLTFNELNQILISKKIEVERKGYGLSKIYAEIINTNSIRVLSVTDNYPESCIIYDIINFEFYKSEIEKMKGRNEFADENEFWNSIILK